MSLIPKISIGRYNKKNEFHIPSLTHGTSEIGYVCPSYSRNLINDATIKIGTRTAVRLSPLFVPTMGDMSVRLYHNFIPFNKIWTPFDAFLDKKPFTFPTGFTKVPKSIPHFYVGKLLRYLIVDNNYSILDRTTFEFNRLASDLTATIYFRSRGSYNDWWHPVNARAYNTDTDFSSVESLRGAIPKLFGSVNPLKVSTYGGAPSFAIIPNDDNYGGSNDDTYVRFYYDTSTSSVQSLSYSHSNTPGIPGDIPSHLVNVYNNFYNKLGELSIPSYDNCDFSVRVDDVDGYDFTICYNFNGAWKRLRSIFLGLGYSFNPYDMNLKVTPLKLIAFYRAYWSHFGVNRDVNFQDTYCCKFGRYISRFDDDEINYITDSGILAFCRDELTNCTYTTPSDYFSSAVQNTQQGVLNMVDHGDMLTVDSYQTSASGQGGLYGGPNTVRVGVASDIPVVSPNERNIGNNALGIQMALKLLRWVNRYTSVGSQIYDGLQSRYGKIEVSDESTEGVLHLGDSSTSVDIGAIFNQSETQEGQLGSFAGVGTGSSRSDVITFDAPSFGVFITLTAVVPQMGYFQGALKENSDGVGDSFEMFDSTFDAVGWQPVNYSELVADRQFVFSGDEAVGTELPTFGYQPRYTHMKVGFNRCIGDISLPHMQDSMLPYTLDRFFPQRVKDLPSASPQWFRSGTRGETNRIFNVISPTDDHVIWQIYFDVDMYAPMKSISDSYDTYLPDDTTSIEVSHE